MPKLPRVTARQMATVSIALMGFAKETSRALVDVCE
jgi:hypothetical protein